MLKYLLLSTAVQYLASTPSAVARLSGCPLRPCARKQRVFKSQERRDSESQEILTFHPFSSEQNMWSPLFVLVLLRYVQIDAFRSLLLTA